MATIAPAATPLAIEVAGLESNACLLIEREFPAAAVAVRTLGGRA